MPNTVAASPRKVASPITRTRSARPAASSGIDEEGGALAFAEPKAETAPRQIHVAKGSGRTGRGVAGRVNRRGAGAAGASFEEDRETGTAAAAELGVAEDVGGEDEEVAEDVWTVDAPGAGSGRRDAL